MIPNPLKTTKFLHVQSVNKQHSISKISPSAEQSEHLPDSTSVVPQHLCMWNRKSNKKTEKQAEKNEYNTKDKQSITNTCE